MSRREVIGVCRICEKKKKLTFEHVPPETTFNNYAVKMLSGEKALDLISNTDKLPWEYNKNEGRIQQRGRGGYYLCSNCNSYTGAWYVPEYSKFVHAIHGALQQVKGQKYESIGMTIKHIRPLPVFKQIITMFCDINNGHMGDYSLKDYLLNKDNLNFNKKRYNVFAHIHTGPIERMNGIMVQYTSKYGCISLSEITTYPIGFTLYIDKPETLKPLGVDITIFSDFKYDEERDIDLIIPKLDSNTIISGDYRTKEEILDDIEKSKKFNV